MLRHRDRLKTIRYSRSHGACSKSRVAVYLQLLLSKTVHAQLLLLVVKDLLVNAKLERYERAISYKERTDADVEGAHAISLDLRLEGVLEVFVLKYVVNRLQSALDQVKRILDH